MSDSTFYRQERAMTCVVAALRSVLATQFGVRVREDVLRFAGDEAIAPIVKEGTGVTQLRNMLAVANRAVNTGPRWRLRVFRHAAVADAARELRAGRFPLAAVRNAVGMHMVVLIDYKPGLIRYFDPADGSKRWIGSGAFRRQWMDVRGHTWLGVIVG